ncbi:MAG: 50S ribosomal protein L30 [Bacteroidetes bacterium CG2_30_33_31]|nr:MAG: 50S ribosomal protein L30 [Bacteroidetes bacterium CG2_30_33_31]
MKRLRIKQVKSGIGRPKRQKRTLKALGLKKMNRSREIDASPQVLGMIDNIKHLLSVEEI